MSTKELIQREANKYLRYKCVLDTIDPYEIGQFRMEVGQAFNRMFLPETIIPQFTIQTRSGFLSSAPLNRVPICHLI